MYDLDFGLGFKYEMDFSCSAVPAKILYSAPFTYTLDANGKSIVQNQGSGADMLVASGWSVLLSPVQEIPFTVGTRYITWFDFSDDLFHSQTGDKTLTDGEYNNIAITETDFDAHDKLAIQENPNLLGKWALSATGTIPELNKVGVATDEYYFCGENGAYCVDARNPYGTEDKFLRWVIYGTNTSTDVNSNNITIDIGDSHNGGYARTDGVLLVAGNIYIVRISELNYSEPMSDETITVNGSDLINQPLREGNYVFRASSTSSIQVYFNQLKLGSTITLTVEYMDATAKEIANFTTEARLIRKGTGLQSTAFKLDSDGVPTAYDDTRLIYNPNSDITIPLDTPMVHTLTKDIIYIEGDGTTATITHSDDTTLVLP